MTDTMILRHSPEMIQKLESAGLGYHKDSGEAGVETFGGNLDVPLRELVYRVHPLPHSMLPLVWDFGTITDEVELLYVSQMVAKTVRCCTESEGPTESMTSDELQMNDGATFGDVEDIDATVLRVSDALASSQAFMRTTKVFEEHGAIARDR
jgi:hypothetical protein